MRNDVNGISFALTVAHMVSFRFGVTALFEDGLIRTFWQTGSTVNTFGGNQQCHDACLLLDQNRSIDRYM
jgi:hypothetical protein